MTSCRLVWQSCPSNPNNKKSSECNYHSSTTVKINNRFDYNVNKLAPEKRNNNVEFTLLNLLYSGARQNGPRTGHPSHTGTTETGLKGGPGGLGGIPFHFYFLNILIEQ